MNLILLIIGGLVIFGAGVLVGIWAVYGTPTGTLVVDESAEDGVYLFLEIEKDAKLFTKKKKVIFKVKNKKYLE